MILSVEGIDGAGKNTLVTGLTAHLNEYGVSVETLAFPRYDVSVHAQLASKALYGQMGDLPESVYGMATLFALDRYGAKDYLSSFVGDTKRTIILDRYVASNAAYSAARVGGFPAQEAEDVVNWVYQMEYGHMGLPTPDAQIYLATSTEVAQQRARDRALQDSTRQRDLYEQDDSLQARTSQAYSELARRNWAGQWLATDDVDMIYASIEKQFGLQSS